MAKRPATAPAARPAPRREAELASAQLDLFADLAPADAPLVPGRPAPQPHSIQLPPGARWREVMAEGQLIRFVLQRSRRRTIGFLIGDDGLRVTAPRWVGLAEIDAAVREKSRWILSKLRDWQQRKERLALNQTRWEDGGELPYLGRRVVMRLDAQRETGLQSVDPDAPADGDILWLGLPHDAEAARIRDAVQAWLQGRARSVFDARLREFLARTGLAIKRWKLSSAATRWGSCTSEGSILLNWRLIHFPLDIIDYVIAHELAHLREMNHGPGFWAEVGQLLPGFESARDVLRRHDPASLPQFD
ncbi:M48 family metallopeptidase [Pigmentiphaga sp.]|uniref:M48 family metallopeptidase n=1 Tax=Pigmentiphaga sp. TaxID=1977564 RepID=UPI0025EECBDE|nr:SprT family zinc-dependent metalloprotease [Pigmentiphaga sp.]MBX6316882.1 M48 family metallopeptidase [Pigmentiphaga sp.]